MSVVLRRAALAASVGLALVTAGAATTSVTAAAPSPQVAVCEDGADGAARATPGSKAEPELYDKNQANAYGALVDRPTLPNGSIEIPVVFNMLSDHDNTAEEKARWLSLIDAQMTVLNDSFSGATADDAADTPFRFTLSEVTWTVNAAWDAVIPSKKGTERAMKKALHQGDARTLNVYAGNIGGGLLGWAYFPKGYNNGRDYIDGVVMLDETMPGGVNPDDPSEPWVYGGGDTLTHEVGHWLMLEHTFAHGCAASGDWVTDTPAEAAPQFGCPTDDPDTCPAPGLDPIHNFMDYTEDACMDMFTQGQADRMSDAWLQFRAGGGKGS